MKNSLFTIGYIVYFAMGLVQIAAIVAGFEAWWGWNGFFAILGSIFVAYIPVLGTIVGIMGAIKGWNWSPIQAILLFCWPLVIYIGVFLYDAICAVFTKHKPSINVDTINRNTYDASDTPTTLQNSQRIEDANLENETVDNQQYAGPWRRWAARCLDYGFEEFIIYIFASLFLNISDYNRFFITIIIAPFVFLLDSAIYATFGNTFGKWIFGVKTIECDGSCLKPNRFFIRNMSVYLSGYGLKIPLVILCTTVFQYCRVSKGLPTSYDEKLDIRCIKHNTSVVKSSIGIIVIIATYILAYV